MIVLGRVKRYGEPAIAFLIFTGFVIYLSLSCFKVRWGGDLALYVAALRALYTNFGNPAHETLAISGTYSHMFSPYIVGMAAVGRAMGLSEYRTLQWAGVFNLFFYVGAVVFFFRRFSLFARSWYPPTIFLLVSALLYNHHFHWSSEMHLDTIRMTQAYPSFIAWAVALTSFAVADRYLKDMKTRDAVIVAALVWFLLLTHPLTASWVTGILGLQGLIALVSGNSEKSRVTALYVAVLAGMFATFGWTYMDLPGLVSGAAAIDEAPPFARKPFSMFIWMYLLAIPCTIYLIQLRRHTFLILGFTSTFLAYMILSRGFGIDFVSRYVYFQAFFAQVAVAEVTSLGILAWLRSGLLRDAGLLNSSAERIIAGCFSAVVIAAVIWSPVTRHAVSRGSLKAPWTLIHADSAHDEYYHRFSELQEMLTAEDVLIVPRGLPQDPIVSLTGVRLVFTPSALGTPDYQLRARGNELFFSEHATQTDRAQLIESYDVTRILLGPSESHLTNVFEEQFGTPVLKNDRFTLFVTGRPL